MRVATGDTICLRLLQVDSIFTFIRQVAVLFPHTNIFVFIRQLAPVPAVGYLRRLFNKVTFDLLISGVRLTCDEGYLCANFSLPIGLTVLELGPMYATDRQTDRQTSDRSQTKASLNASALWGGGIISRIETERREGRKGKIWKEESFKRATDNHDLRFQHELGRARGRPVAPCRRSRQIRRLTSIVSNSRL